MYFKTRANPIWMCRITSAIYFRININYKKLTIYFNSVAHRHMLFTAAPKMHQVSAQWHKKCTVGGNADWCSHCVWDFLKKLKVELPFYPAIPLLGLYPINPETPIQKNLCPPMFIAVLETVPISKWVDQKTVVHVHNGILHSRKKEGAPIFHDSMDGTGEHYAKWNKPSSER